MEPTIPKHHDRETYDPSNLNRVPDEGNGFKGPSIIKAPSCLVSEKPVNHDYYQIREVYIVNDDMTITRTHALGTKEPKESGYSEDGWYTPYKEQSARDLKTGERIYNAYYTEQDALDVLRDLCNKRAKSTQLTLEVMDIYEAAKRTS